METPPSISTDIKPQMHYFEASLSQRFSNYIIDISVVGAFGACVRLLIKHFETEGNLSIYDNPIIVLLMQCVVIFLYYVIFESATGGRTLGKYITRTSAVRADSLPLTADDVLKRSLCRLVPLEAFSAFTELWHDKWTKTRVVKI